MKWGMGSGKEFSYSLLPTPTPYSPMTDSAHQELIRAEEADSPTQLVAAVGLQRLR